MSLDLQVTDLAPIVARSLGKPSLEITEWDSFPLSAGGSRYLGGPGIYRVAGTARHDTRLVSWSMIVKISKGGAEMASDDPGAWNYWKRETLAYQPGLLGRLPAGIVAPRCYAVQERSSSEYWLWLEEIQSPQGDWTMARHGLAARHLGQFNGAYLAGHPLPAAQPWMTWGRTRPWVEFIRPWAERAPQYANTLLARRWFGDGGLAHTLRLLARMETALVVFERLPVCYCHHDAFRRNLLDQPRSDGSSETVAIDWALTGFGRIGEEIGATLAVGLAFLDVPARQARELNEAVFSGYIDGLYDAGWRGDVRLARLGCTVNALILTGLLWNLWWLESLQKPEEIVALEAIMNRSFDAIIDQYSEMLPFILDLGDEALTLIETVDED